MNDRPEQGDWPEPVQDMMVIVTRNKKDFKGPNIRVPYGLETVTSTRVINVRPPPP
jgi:hypothetical protein